MNRAGVAGAAGVVLAGWLWLYFAPPAGLDFGKPGTHDFVQYWSAMRLFAAGQNPYDGDRMHDFQVRAVGQDPDDTMMMWNPPWVVVLLWPVLALDFPQAALAWALLNLAALVVLALAGPAAVGVRLPPIPALAACVLFYPSVQQLALGQLGLLMAAGAVGFLGCVRAGRYGLAGLCLLPLTVKPHLCFLLAVPALLWVVQGPKRWRALAGLGAGLGLAVAACALALPGSLGAWWASLGAEAHGPGVVAPRDWQTATLATWVRRALQGEGAGPPLWPLWGVPAAAFGLVALWCASRRPKIDWAVHGPPLLCLSLGANAYGWVFDQCLLLPVQLAILGRAGPGRVGPAAGAVAAQVACFAQAALGPAPQHAYAWLPWALLALYAWSRGTGASGPEGGPTGAGVEP